VVVNVVGAGAALVLASLAVLHVYWAFGGPKGRAAAVPEVGDRALFSPSKAATLVVALLLAASTVIVVGGVRAWEPRLLFEIGCAGIAAVLIARSIGDRRYVGVLKRVKGTEFARRDTWLYSPLCLVLAIATAAVALSR
jgi:Protein of unknown function (DUF3995)